MEHTQAFDLSGRVALVTGGNGGIGRAIALAMARAGAAVAIAGRNPAKNAAVASELDAIGNPSCAVALDLSDRSQLNKAYDSIEQTLGSVDILVNNAGMNIMGAGILGIEADDWDKVIEVNLNAVYLLSRLAATSMIERASRGKIINIASEYSRFGSGLIPAYSASKGAIVQLTKSMAIELAPHKIQVNAIAPGWIETEMTEIVKTLPLNDEILNRTPAGRWGTPDDCAGAGVFLASPAADFITGVTLFVDGGYAIR